MRSQRILAIHVILLCAFVNASMRLTNGLLTQIGPKIGQYRRYPRIDNGIVADMSATVSTVSLATSIALRSLPSSISSDTATTSTSISPSILADTDTTLIFLPPKVSPTLQSSSAPILQSTLSSIRETVTAVSLPASPIQSSTSLSAVLTSQSGNSTTPSTTRPDWEGNTRRPPFNNTIPSHHVLTANTTRAISVSAVAGFVLLLIGGFVCFRLRKRVLERRSGKNASQLSTSTRKNKISTKSKRYDFNRWTLSRN